MESVYPQKGWVERRPEPEFEVIIEYPPVVYVPVVVQGVRLPEQNDTPSGQIVCPKVDIPR
jgi:hypothetical protein